MADTQVSGAAGRYAKALHELAVEGDALDRTEADMKMLGDTLQDSQALRDMLRSPVYAGEDKARAMNAVADKMGLSDLVRNTIALMGRKGRLQLVPEMIDIFHVLMARHRGEITAEVISAKPLTDAQAQDLSKTLKSAEGRDVKLDVTVDESLIGGLVVKVGSRMIDTSIRSKLNQLRNAMREVG